MSLTGLALSGKRILITGGTGFIGSRLVERLVLEENAKGRVLVHNPANADRVARLPVEMVHGDVLNPNDMAHAAENCEIIFHCAYGTSADQASQRRVNVDGTRNLLDAASRAKVKRVVHFSTLMVYGITGDGDLDERARRRYFGNAYAESKLDAEQMAFDYMRQHRLPIVVLQPTAVYGPFAVQWTQRVLEKMKSGRVILVNGGDGLRNAVYIDDLVSAAILAAVKENSAGEAFLISGDDPGTWLEFYRAFERMLGLDDRLVSLSAAEARRLYVRANRPRGILAEMRAMAAANPDLRHRLLKTRELAFVLKSARRLVPAPLHARLKSRFLATPTARSPATASLDHIHLLDPATIRFYAAKTRVRIDKAKRILGYQPAFEFSYGMQLTERWARWANLLGSAEPRLRRINLGSQPNFL